MTKTLRDLLDDQRVHLLDGAMGTMLYNQGVFVNVCYDELNLSQPEIIQSVHDAYVKSGAEIIETNTFGANPVKLTSHSLESQTEEINHRAVEIALGAADGRAVVAGAIGPLGIRIEPWGPTAREEAEEYFGRQVTGLLSGGVHGFVLETFSDVEEIQAAIRAIRSQTQLPIIAQMTVNQEGSTSYGTAAETIASTLQAAGVDAVGINCSVGPAAMLDTIERLAETTTLPISAQPNAGLPREVGDRKIYMASPEYMAQYARRMLDAGARFIGGCCGTTPDHIKHIGDYIKSVQPRSSAPYAIVTEPLPDSAVEPCALAERSAFGQRLSDGSFAWTAQIRPPPGWDPSPLIAACLSLEATGIDAVHIADSAQGHGRMGALPAAMIVERDTDIETIVQYTCRDRNMLGMVNDLLGAAGAGLRNLLVQTGDPPVTGPYPDSTAVFDIDSIGLTNIVHRMNRGLDPGGNALSAPTKYVVGVAANQSALDATREAERFRWKVDAGADVAVSQPVFDVPQLLTFLDQHNTAGLPVVATIWPLTSLRSAEFLANEVPGVLVPEAIVQRMRVAQSSGSEAAFEEGLGIALETIDAVRSHVQGAQILAPFGKVGVALKVLEALAIDRERRR